MSAMSIRKLETLDHLNEFNDEIGRLTKSIKRKPEAGFFEYIFNANKLWDKVVESNNVVMQALPAELELSEQVFLVYIQFHLAARNKELKNWEQLKKSGFNTLVNVGMAFFGKNVSTLLSAARGYLSFAVALEHIQSKDVWRGEKGYYDTVFGAYKIESVREQILLQRAHWEYGEYMVGLSLAGAAQPFVRTNGGPSEEVLEKFAS
jgi:hypothetical protein